jgi:trigger factor
MNANVETTSALGRKLTIEVAPDEIRTELDRAYNELKRGVQMKGFRQGRAPRRLLERFFGDQVRSEVIQKLVQEYTQKALAQNDLKPVVAPEIVTEETDLAKALKFSAVFDIRPAVVVKDYERLKIQEPRVEVKDADVDAALERLRERHGTLKKVEGRDVVQEDDFVVATLEALENGKPLEGVKPENRLLHVNPKALAHGIEEVLIGAVAGKPAEKMKSYPADYAEKEIAGKTVQWRVNVRDILKRELPALDDDFAKDVGEYKSLEALRERVRKDLLDNARAEADGRARQGLLDLILERTPLDLPQSLVAREQRVLESELHSTLEGAGVPHPQVEERVKQSADELKKRAERRAHTALVLDAIAEQEKVEVNDEEVGDRIATMVTQAGRERDRVAQFYRSEENREALKRSMRRDKSLEVVMSRAQKTEEGA